MIMYEEKLYTYTYEHFCYTLLVPCHEQTCEASDQCSFLCTLINSIYAVDIRSLVWDYFNLHLPERKFSNSLQYVQ